MATESIPRKCLSYSDLATIRHFEVSQHHSGPAGFRGSSLEVRLCSERGLPEDRKPIKRSRSDQSLTTAVLLGGSSCHDYSLAVQYGGQARPHPPSPFIRCTRPTLPVVLSDYGSSTNSLVSLDSELTRSSTSLPALQALVHAASGGIPPSTSALNISTLTQASSAVSLFQAQAHLCPELMRVESEVSMDATSEAAGGMEGNGEAAAAGRGLVSTGSEGSSMGASPSSSQACIPGMLGSSSSRQSYVGPTSPAAAHQQQQRPPMGRTSFGGGMRARLQALLPSALLRGGSGELRASAGTDGAVDAETMQQQGFADSARSLHTSCPGGRSSSRKESEVFTAGPSASAAGRASSRSLSSPGRTTSSPLSSSSGRSSQERSPDTQPPVSSCPPTGAAGRESPSSAAAVAAGPVAPGEVPGAVARPLPPPAVACIHTLQANLLQPVVPPTRVQSTPPQVPPARSLAPAAAGGGGVTGSGPRFSAGVSPTGAGSLSAAAGSGGAHAWSGRSSSSGRSNPHRDLLGGQQNGSFSFAPLPGPAAAAAVAATAAAHAGHVVPPATSPPAAGTALGIANTSSSSSSGGSTWAQAAAGAAVRGGSSVGAQQGGGMTPVAAAGGGAGLVHARWAAGMSSPVFSAPLPGARRGLGLPMATRGASIDGAGAWSFTSRRLASVSAPGNGAAGPGLRRRSSLEVTMPWRAQLEGVIAAAQTSPLVRAGDLPEKGGGDRGDHMEGLLITGESDQEESDEEGMDQYDMERMGSGYSVGNDVGGDGEGASVGAQQWQQQPAVLSGQQGVGSPVRGRGTGFGSQARKQHEVMSAFGGDDGRLQSAAGMRYKLGQQHQQYQQQKEEEEQQRQGQRDARMGSSASDRSSTESSTSSGGSNKQLAMSRDGRSSTDMRTSGEGPRRVSTSSTGSGPRIGSAYYSNSSSSGGVAFELFVRLNHARQTLDYAKRQATAFAELNRGEMHIWSALNMLNGLREYEAALLNGSDAQEEPLDPDLSLQQHAVQVAELCRLTFPDKPWLHLVGLIHGLGKLLAHEMFGSQPQWAVAGESYPLGCRFAQQISHSEYFSANPDRRRRAFCTPLGIYHQGCGLKNVFMSWGAAEYLYMMLVLNQVNLPEEALFIIRFQKFYSLPSGAYRQLLSPADQEMLPLLAFFQKLSVYRRVEMPPETLQGEALVEYYSGLINHYLGEDKLFW